VLVDGISETGVVFERCRRPTDEMAWKGARLCAEEMRDERAGRENEHERSVKQIRPRAENQTKGGQMRITMDRLAYLGRFCLSTRYAGKKGWLIGWRHVPLLNSD
jgi:hypothetical protein